MTNALRVLVCLLLSSFGFGAVAQQYVCSLKWPTAEDHGQLGGPDQTLPSTLRLDFDEEIASLANAQNPGFLNFQVHREIRSASPEFPDRRSYFGHRAEGLFRSVDIDPATNGDVSIVISGADPDPRGVKPNQWQAGYECRATAFAPAGARRDSNPD